MPSTARGLIMLESRGKDEDIQLLNETYIGLEIGW